MTADTVASSRSTSRLTTLPWETVALITVSILLVLAATGVLPWEVGWLEAGAVLTGAVSVWLLARNDQWGWWIGIVSVVLFGALFLSVQLYAEVGIQAVYGVTSVYAIWLWLRGGERHDGRPVAYLAGKHWAWIVPVFGASWLALHALLVQINGALPFWDSLTTVMSLTAHLLLMGRFVNSWWLWVAVDVIYVPLYLSRGLTLTAVLYIGFFVMACAGWARFRSLARTSALQTDDAGEGR